MKLTYAREIADVICRRLAEGDSLRRICETEENFPHEASVRYWAKHDIDGFSERFEIARSIGLEGMLDKMIAIASKDMHITENGVRKVDNAAVSQARLVIDTMKWQASKQMPAKYGDRIQAEVTGPNGGPIQLEAVRSTIADRIARLAHSRTTSASLGDREPDRVGGDRGGLENNDQDELVGMGDGSTGTSRP